MHRAGMRRLSFRKRSCGRKLTANTTGMVYKRRSAWHANGLGRARRRPYDSRDALARHRGRRAVFSMDLLRATYGRATSSHGRRSRTRDDNRRGRRHTDGSKNGGLPLPGAIAKSRAGIEFSLHDFGEISKAPLISDDLSTAALCQKDPP